MPQERAPWDVSAGRIGGSQAMKRPIASFQAPREVIDPQAGGECWRISPPAGRLSIFPAPALRRPMPLPACLPLQPNVVLHLAGQVRAPPDLKSCLQMGTGIEIEAEPQRR